MGNHRRRRKHGKKSTAQHLYEQMGGEGECYVATNVHHRRSKHTGGSNSESNLSRVPVKAHNEYNRLFRDGHMHPTEMAKVLTDKWIDPAWEMVARRKGERHEEVRSEPPETARNRPKPPETPVASHYHRPDCQQCPKQLALLRLSEAVQHLATA